MEQQSTKIKFYVRRTFGEKLNATFDFIKQNWKPLFKYTTYFILPICLIQAFFLNKSMGWMTAIFAATTDIYGMDGYNQTYYFLGIFLNIIGSTVLVSPVYAIMQLYNNTPGRLENITFNDLKPYVFHNMGRYLLSMIVVVIFGIIFGAIFVALAVSLQLMWFVLLLYIVMLIVYIPLSLIVPIMIFERISLGKAFVKSFKLGFPTWGGIFGVWFVMGILYSILAGVVMIPFMVVYLVNYFMGISDTTLIAETSTFYSIGMYLLGILSIYGAYLFMILPVIGIAYQYAHANEKLNSISVVDEIDNFENF